MQAAVRLVDPEEQGQEGGRGYWWFCHRAGLSSAIEHRTVGPDAIYLAHELLEIATVHSPDCGWLLEPNGDPLELETLASILKWPGRPYNVRIRIERAMKKLVKAGTLVRTDDGLLRFNSRWIVREFVSESAQRMRRLRRKKAESEVISGGGRVTFASHDPLKRREDQIRGVKRSLVGDSICPIDPEPEALPIPEPVSDIGETTDPGLPLYAAFDELEPPEPEPPEPPPPIVPEAKQPPPPSPQIEQPMPVPAAPSAPIAAEVTPEEVHRIWNAIVEKKRGLTWDEAQAGLGLRPAGDLSLKLRGEIEGFLDDPMRTREWVCDYFRLIAGARWCRGQVPPREGSGYDRPFQASLFWACREKSVLAVFESAKRNGQSTRPAVPAKPIAKTPSPEDAAEAAENLKKSQQIIAKYGSFLAYIEAKDRMEAAA